MSANYRPEQIDALLKACIDYHDAHDHFFAVANIAGQSGVSANIDDTRELMEWLTKDHERLLRAAGLGFDAVPYYQLGWDARTVMNSGGFSKYLERKQRKEFVTQTKDWLPIVASLAAVVVSVFAWQAPKDNDRAFAEVNKKIEQIETRLEQQKNISADLATALVDVRRDVKKAAMTKSERVPDPKQ